MGEKEKISGQRLVGWLGLSRPPYHTCGLLPFLLGTVLAWRLDHLFNLPLFIFSLCGIALVMVFTFYTGEYTDRAMDPVRGLLDRIPVSKPEGVWRVLAASPISLKIGITSLLLASLIALFLQFVLHTGPLTFLLGCIGALPGFCYATRTCRWMDRGFGEGITSICYSWLPVTAGFYLQTGEVAACIHWIALPIGLSIFNVILLNEFVDYGTPAASGKTPLLTKLGKARGMALYVLCAILSWFSFYRSLVAGVPRKAIYLYLPVMLLSAVICLMMARRKYTHHFLLEWLCGLNIAVYLGTTGAYLLTFY